MNPLVAMNGDSNPVLEDRAREAARYSKRVEGRRAQVVNASSLDHLKRMEATYKDGDFNEGWKHAARLAQTDTAALIEYDHRLRNEARKAGREGDSQGLEYIMSVHDSISSLLPRTADQDYILKEAKGLHPKEKYVPKGSALVTNPS